MSLKWTLMLILILCLPIVHSFTNDTFRAQEGYFGANLTITTHIGAFQQFTGNITSDLCYGFFCTAEEEKPPGGGGRGKFEKYCGINLTGVWIDGEWVCIPTKELIMRRGRIDWIILLTLAIPFIFIFLYRRKKKKEELLRKKREKEEKNVNRTRSEKLLEQIKEPGEET